jgi:hypothetical protein
MSVWGKWKKRWLRCGWFAATSYLVRVQAAGSRQEVDLIETMGDMSGTTRCFWLVECAGEEQGANENETV